jgi:methylated-DNA-protein-cysteine methyltransferase-like protein
MREASFSDRAKQAITAIPRGTVATYGQIAACAGNHRASRQVAWLLHSSSRKDNLPWHRVINSRGSISLPIGGGFEEQKVLLEGEGVRVDERGRIDLSKFLWNPGLV